jgi:hypothetical protein
LATQNNDRNSGSPAFGRESPDAGFWDTRSQIGGLVDSAPNWLSENNINDGDQIRFRAEAESLLKSLPSEMDRAFDHPLFLVLSCSMFPFENSKCRCKRLRRHCQAFARIKRQTKARV